MSEKEPTPKVQERLAQMTDDELVKFIENPITPEIAGEELTRRLGAVGLHWRMLVSDDGQEVYITREGERL